jgi:hypothetical protein
MATAGTATTAGAPTAAGTATPAAASSVGGAAAGAWLVVVRGGVVVEVDVDVVVVDVEVVDVVVVVVVATVPDGAPAATLVVCPRYLYATLTFTPVASGQVSAKVRTTGNVGGVGSPNVPSQAPGFPWPGPRSSPPLVVITQLLPAFNTTGSGPA